MAHGGGMTKRTRETGEGAAVDSAERQSRQRVAAHYREYSAQLRELAAAEHDTIIRTRLLAIAEEYAARADRLDAQS